jgi:hypothetical protein
LPPTIFGCEGVGEGDDEGGDEDGGSKDVDVDRSEVVGGSVTVEINEGNSEALTHPDWQP